MQLISAGNIVEVLQADERFSTLVAAVVKAELVEALSGGKPFFPMIGGNIHIWLKSALFNLLIIGCLSLLGLGFLGKIFLCQNTQALFNYFEFKEKGIEEWVNDPDDRDF